MNSKALLLSMGSVLLLMSMVAVACSAEEPAAPAAPAPAAPATGPAPAPGAPAAPALPEPPQPAMPAPKAAFAPAAPTPAGAVMKTGPQYGGSLNFHRPYTPTGWDLGQAHYKTQAWNFTAERLLISDIDGAGPRGANITTFRTQGATPLATIVPHLIDSWELPDDTTIVFHLKEGINYFDKPPVNGRELDAEDVAVALTRLQNVPRFLTGYWDFVDNIEATDKYTIQINTNAFNANWKWLFGPGWYNSIYPRELAEQGLFTWEDVNGTGPFMVTDYVTDVSATYERNPDYWGTTKIDGTEFQLPFVDTMRITFVEDPAAYLAAFRTGKLDFIMNVTGDQKEDLVKTTSGLQIFNAFDTPNIKGLGIRVDLPDEPTSDIRVRKALSMAINREDFHEKIFSNNSVRRYYSIVPAGWSLNLVTPVDELPADLVEGHTWNVAGAKQLLADAGYPDGFKTQIEIEDRPFSVDMASLLAAYWKDIGVEIDIKVMEATAFKSRLLEGEHAPLGIYPLGGTPLASLGLQSAVAPYNWARWSTPGFEETAKVILQESDPDVAAIKLKELNIASAQGYHNIQLGTGFSHNVGHPWVKNWYGEFDLGHELYVPVMSRMQIDEGLR
jgi:peptide/nickel transport system substrate-binding protein